MNYSALFLRIKLFILGLCLLFITHHNHASIKLVETIGAINWNEDDLRAQLEEFEYLYKQRPIRNNMGGMNSAHMYYVWFLTKRLNPIHIIESGIWKGQSTWLFEQAAPQAKIISIDPKLGKREYISTKVNYTKTDFSKIDWSVIVDKENTLCFFDDHVGSHRLKQCYENGFKHILYEDNYPGPGGNWMKDALSVKAALQANGDEARYLRSIIKTYYEFPPIFNPRFTKEKWRSFRVPGKQKDCTKNPLVTQKSENYHNLYYSEAEGYRWIAYIELR